MRNTKKSALLFWILSALLIVSILQARTRDEEPSRAIARWIETLAKNPAAVPSALLSMQESVEKLIQPPRKGNGSPRYQKIASAGPVTLFEVIEQEWDGSQWHNARRSEITWHDTHGYTDIFNQEWDGSQWVNRQRITSAFNTQEQITSVQADTWSGSAWSPVSTIRKAYDAQGNQIEEIWQTASGDDGTLQNFMREVYTYEGGNLMKTEGHFWMDGLWVKTQETVNDYNAQGLLAAAISSYVINQQVINMGKNLYTYHASGLLESKTQQSVDIFTQTWVNETKTSYQYHISGDLTAELYQIWDGGAWNNHTLYTALFDNQARLIEEVYGMWRDADWQNQERGLYAYDGNGNNTVYTEQIWEDEAWRNAYNTLSTFDSAGRPLEEKGQSWENGQWVNDERSLYNWGFQSAIEKIERFLPVSFDVGNYPNPFNPSTTILLSLPAHERLSLRVYDLRGSLIKTLADSRSMNAGVHAVPWDGTDQNGMPVPSGFYFYRVEGEHHSATGRCMLVK